MDQPTPITRILERVSTGDRNALDDLLPLVYAEMRRLAAKVLGSDRNHTLQPTALVHEAYLRLFRIDDAAYSSRAHLFAVAAKAMRQILTDYARRKRATKRDAPGGRVALDQAAPAGESHIVDMIDLEDALVELERLDERKSRVVELRFFAGLTNDEVAEVLGVSRKTVAGDWAVARAWLSRRLIAADGT